MTNAYLLPPRLDVANGPNKSIWINCKGLEVLIWFLGLKLRFICFPNWHASHTLSLTNLIWGIPLTSSLDEIWVISFMLDDLISHAKAKHRHSKSKKYISLQRSLMSMVYILFYFSAIIDVFLYGFSIMQALDSNLTIYPLSHNWLILKRLYFKPSTNKTSSIKKLDLLPMVPLPMILPLLLSPKVTYPSSRLVS